MEKHKAKIIDVSDGSLTLQFESSDTGKCSGCCLASSCRPSKEKRIILPVSEGAEYKRGETVILTEHKYTPFWCYVLLIALIVAGVFIPDSIWIALALVFAVVSRFLFAKHILKVEWRISPDKSQSSK